MPYALIYTSSIKYAARSDCTNRDIRSSCSIMVDQRLKWGRARERWYHSGPCNHSKK